MSSTTTREQQISAVRRFNRFYTQNLGVLQEAWLDSPFSLAEARVLYELERRGTATATDIANDLGLDAGYLSRILRGFHRKGLIARKVSPDDGRQSLLSLTARGRKAYAPLETHTNRQIDAMLERLPGDGQDRLLTALRTAETLLAPKPKSQAEVILRPPRPGDFGWMVARHAILYAREYRWTEPFEGLCAQIVADFANKHDPSCERCWIAEYDGDNAGSVMLVRDSAEVARLRLLLVEPAARGHGIGTRLTAECIRFARQCGYKKMTLWTHAVLTAARKIYAEAGFRLTSSEPRHSWGQDVVSEQWDMTL